MKKSFLLFFILINFRSIAQDTLVVKPNQNVSDVSGSFSVEPIFSDVVISYFYRFHSSDPMYFQNYFFGSHENYLMFTGQGGYNSNMMNASFANHLINKGFIDEELKNEVYKKLSTENQLNGYYNLNMTFLTRLNPDDKSPLQIQLSNRQIIKSNFTKPDFQLAFSGNAMFAGDTVQISPASFEQYSFRQLSIGTSKWKSFQHFFMSAYAQINVLDGVNASQIKIDDATLFTEANGQYLDISDDFTFHKSDSGPDRLYFSDGAGLATDLNVMLSLNTQKPWEFTAQLSDFGFIKWNQKATTYSSDTAFHFTGLEVSNLLSPNSDFSFAINTDTLLKYTGTSKISESFKTNLPYQILFLVTHELFSHNYSSMGLKILPTTSNSLFLFVRNDFVSNQLVITQLAGYGPSYGFAFGSSIGTTFLKDIAISVGSDNLLAFVLPHKFTYANLIANVGVAF